MVKDFLNFSEENFTPETPESRRAGRHHHCTIYNHCGCMDDKIPYIDDNDLDWDSDLDLPE